MGTLDDYSFDNEFRGPLDQTGRMRTDAVLPGNSLVPISPTDIYLRQFRLVYTRQQIENLIRNCERNEGFSQTEFKQTTAIPNVRGIPFLVLHLTFYLSKLMCPCMWIIKMGHLIIHTICFHTSAAYFIADIGLCTLPSECTIHISYVYLEYLSRYLSIVEAKKIFYR